MALTIEKLAKALGGSVEDGRAILDFLNSPANSVYLAYFLWLVDAVLCALIIRTVDYTEIDWKSYMQQIALVTGGERDYTLIKGDTGPLVYPALHVWIYRVLYDLTYGGKSIILAEVLFAILYCFNLLLIIGCYRQARVPPYIFPLLILSKRLHSIYILRCFNDCFAAMFLFGSIYLFQKRQWVAGAISFSAGVAVKMTLLVAAPAVAMILLQTNGVLGSIRLGGYMLLVQVIPAIPFLQANPVGYLNRSFEFSRTFLYQWSVNWQFVSEEVFLSKNFSYALLSVHAALLGLFVGTRWLRPLGRSARDLVRLGISNPSAAAQAAIVRAVSSDYIMTTMCTSIAIGMLCARSLHFQFFAYIAWTMPFLLWRSKINPLLQIVLWLGQELAWNQYPPNHLSSKIIVGVLAVTVLEVWIATDQEIAKPPPAKKSLQIVVEEDSRSKKQKKKDEIKAATGNYQKPEPVKAEPEPLKLR